MPEDGPTVETDAVTGTAVTGTAVTGTGTAVTGTGTAAGTAWNAVPGLAPSSNELVAALRQQISKLEVASSSGANSTPPVGREEADPELLRAHSAALSQLAARARSTAELTATLTRRGFSEATVETTISRLRDARLLDDQAFAQQWVAERRPRRFLARTALERELTVKGVAPDDMAQALGQVSPEDELDAARALAQKRLRAMSGVPMPAQRRRISAALARRGHSADVIRRVVEITLSGAATNP